MKNKDTSCFMELMKCTNLDYEAQNDKGNTPLHLAAKKRRTDYVETLLAKKAYIDAVNDKGNTPLHLASKRGLVLVVQQLIMNKADTLIRNNYGETHLHLLARTQSTRYCYNPEPVKLDDTTVNDIVGYSPLHHAVLFNNISFAEDLLIFLPFLLNKQCYATDSTDLDDIQDGQCTALHLAMNRHDYPIAQLLMINGARIDLKNQQGKTVQDMLPEVDDVDFKVFINERSVLHDNK
jgi:ankyrin repeat protein